MEKDRKSSIVAVVTTKKENISSGGAPVFLANNKTDLQKLARRLERIMDSSAYELNETTLIIVAR
ncbi:hypothetical protein MUB24_22145 [Lederbergia sp. NSJ-179]|uniref:capping complex subunit for YIEGIA n=1 Tax=Lederbergia sp. NSJ-179 TaxID=2931402 RepID=UPI001FD2DFD3|nr:hypothetical protein [Lederbergia sp. NSJ-179]MCJ7843526.1 hypothetical protein [Lederbergia sp. NSJ-179]